MVTITRKVSVSGGTVLRASNNLGDVVSAPTAFSNIKQEASTSVSGVSMRATAADARTGTDAAKHLTPETMRAGVASLRNARALRQGLVFSGVADASGTLASDLATSAATVVISFEVPLANPAADVGLFHLATARADGTAHELAGILRSTGVLDIFKRGATVGDSRIASITANLVATYAGKLVQLALTRSSATLALYLDGLSAPFTEATSGTPPTWATTWDGTLYEVGSTGAANFFTGWIDGPFVFNRALSASQILALHEHGLAATDYNTAGPRITGDNSTFASDTGFWTLVGSASIGSGACTLADGSGAIRRATELKIGALYTVTVGTIGSGSLFFDGGTGAQPLTAGIAVTFTATQAQFQIYSSGGAVFDNVQLDALGLVLAPESTAPGHGPQRRDVSGSGAHLNLPGDGLTGGVTWALPGGHASDFGEIRTASGYALGRDAPVIAEGYRIARIWVSGNGTFSIGNAASGAEVINAFTATATAQPATLAGYVTASRKLYITLGTATSITYNVHSERI